MPSNSKSYMGFHLQYLYLTLAHCKIQGQGHVHFHNEYLGNGERYGENYVCHQICMGFRLACAHSTTRFEGQGQGYALSIKTLFIRSAYFSLK